MTEPPAALGDDGSGFRAAGRAGGVVGGLGMSGGSYEQDQQAAEAAPGFEIPA
ncbi:heme-binding protein [Streptomyces sp. NBC_00879]|uniref:hypothetical protein n=1 Tax=Streptomyces sp. NBC_00879 TaxID=2975855 RepID=UPI00386B46D1|nr:heme-binding protein [Streptomyces sp. NBC_00879]